MYDDSGSHAQAPSAAQPSLRWLPRSRAVDRAAALHIRRSRDCVGRPRRRGQAGALCPQRPDDSALERSAVPACLQLHCATAPCPPLEGDGGPQSTRRHGAPFIRVLPLVAPVLVCGPLVAGGRPAGALAAAGRARPRRLRGPGYLLRSCGDDQNRVDFSACAASSRTSAAARCPSSPRSSWPAGMLAQMLVAGKERDGDHGLTAPAEPGGWCWSSAPE